MKPSAKKIIQILDTVGGLKHYINLMKDQLNNINKEYYFLDLEDLLWALSNLLKAPVWKLNRIKDTLENDFDVCPKCIGARGVGHSPCEFCETTGIVNKNMCEHEWDNMEHTSDGCNHGLSENSCRCDCKSTVKISTWKRKCKKCKAEESFMWDGIKFTQKRNIK